MNDHTIEASSATKILQKMKRSAAPLAFVVTTLVSALVGGLVNSQLAKARPDPSVTSITLSSPILTDEASSNEGKSTPVQFNAALVAMADDHSWLPSLPSDADSEQEYVRWLLQLKETSTELATQMKRLRKDLSMWPATFDALTMENVYLVIWRNINLIDGHIRGELARNASLLDADPPSYDGHARYFKLETDDDGDYFVEHKTKRIPLIWSTCQTSEEFNTKCLNTMTRIRDALLHGNPTELQRVHKLITAILSEEAATNTVANLVVSELDSFSHWNVNITIANNGREPVAIAPRAGLYLLSKGTVVPDDRGQGTHVPIDLRILLTAETKDSTSNDEQIIVPGGGAVTVNFRSTDTIGESKNGKDALAIFRGPGTQAKVALLRLTGSLASRDGRSILVSAPARFASLSVEEDLPERID